MQLLSFYPGDETVYFLINVLIKVSVLVLAGWLAVKLLRLKSSPLKYGIWLAVLVGIIITPLAEMGARRLGVNILNVSVALPQVEVKVEKETKTEPVINKETKSAGEEIATNNNTQEAGNKLPATSNTMSSTYLSTEVTQSGTKAGSILPTNSSPLPTTYALLPTPSDYYRLTITIVLILWLLGSIYFLLHILYGWYILIRLKRELKPTESPLIRGAGVCPSDSGRQRSSSSLTSISDEVTATLGLKRRPVIMTSTKVGSPITVGLIRPMIIFPTMLVSALEPEQIRDILIHECAHIAHRDYIVGFIQRVVQVLFWFNPLIYIMNNQLCKAREEICDNYVLSISNNAAGYAKCLVDLAEKTTCFHLMPATMGLIHPRWRFEDRINGLLTKERNMITKLNTVAVSILSIALITAMVIMAGCGLGNKRDNDTAELLTNLVKGNWSIIYINNGKLNYLTPNSEIKQLDLPNKDKFNAYKIHYLTIFPSKHRIAFVLSDESIGTKRYEIWSINKDGTSPELLCSLDMQPEQISWSPDGHTIAYWSYRGENKESNEQVKDLCIHEIETKSNTVLKSDCGYRYPCPPSWSPDSRQLVYANKDGWIEIIDAKTKVSHRLTHGEMPAWSPDGKVIAYREEGRKNISSSVSTPKTVYYSISPSGIDNKLIFDSVDASGFMYSGYDKQLAWSPDNQYLLFANSHETLDGGWKTQFYGYDFALGKTMQISKTLNDLPDYFIWDIGDQTPAALEPAPRRKVQLDKFTKDLIAGLNDKKTRVGCAQSITQFVGQGHYLGDAKEAIAKEATPALINMLTDDYWEARQAAIGALTALKVKEAIPEITKLLKDKDAKVSGRAIYALCALGSQETLSAIREFVVGNEPNLQEEAITALSDMGDSSIIPELTKLLNDKNPRIRVVTVYALGKLNARESIPRLVELLNDNNSGIQQGAVWALGKLEAREAIPNIIGLLNNKELTVRDECCYALAHLNAKDAIPDLMKLSNTEPAAIEALGELGAKEAIPGIRKLLSSQSDSLRSSAAYAIGKLNDKDSGSVLTKLLKDNYGWVRFHAAESLSIMGLENGLTNLTKELNNENIYIHGAAAITLVELGKGNQLSQEDIESINWLVNDTVFRDRANNALRALDRIRQNDSRSEQDKNSAVPVPEGTRINHYGADWQPLYALGIKSADYWNKTRPVEFLNFLKNTTFTCISIDCEPPADWIKEGDIEKLIQLIDSKESCSGVISPLSSVVFGSKSSTVGEEAMSLIEGFRKSKYPPGIASGLKPSALIKKREEIRKWWDERKQKGSQAPEPSDKNSAPPDRQAGAPELTQGTKRTLNEKIIDNPTDYLPLQIGNKWCYRTTYHRGMGRKEGEIHTVTYTVTSIQKYNDNECFVIAGQREGPNPQPIFYKVTPDGIISYHGIRGGEAIDFNAPFVDIKNPLKVGQTWNGKGNINILELDFSTTFTGEEEIVTPAGKFLCIKLERELSLGGANSAYIYWYAKSVGLIKLVTRTKGSMLAKGGEDIDELMSFQVNK